MSEFNLIHQYFTRSTPNADLGVGDDAALIRVRDGYQLAISVDMSVAGTHFFADAAPFDIGWKCMAVNISDMAAMGALPKWATLAIALPEINDHWLAEFSRGLFSCADQYAVELIGGDTTRGTLNITIQIMGEVPIELSMQRGGAQAEDDIWVSGHIGGAALALKQLQHLIQVPPADAAECLAMLYRPTPRVALGLALRNVAHSCIDISDGLLADLGHVLTASGLGASIELSHIACPPYLAARRDDPLIQECILAGGDDYELMFTAAESKRDMIHALANTLDLPLSLIGKTSQHPGLQVRYRQQPLTLSKLGFDHFD